MHLITSLQILWKFYNQLLQTSTGRLLYITADISLDILQEHFVPFSFLLLKPLNSHLIPICVTNNNHPFRLADYVNTK